jgi:glycosyltransferase involved in cell wall biosynthesis
MKVLHVLASSDRADGGAVQVVMELAPFLSKKGLGVTIFAPQSRGGETGSKRCQGVDTVLFSTSAFSRLWLGHSRSLTQALFRQVPSFDLIHMHGLWYYPQFIAYRAAMSAKKPFIITVHGELNANKMRFSRLKKRIYSAVIQKKILEQASAIHAVSEQEAEAIRNFTVNKKIFVLRNGLDPKKFDRDTGSTNAGLEDFYSQRKDKKIILFLGRIDEAKGLKILAQAMGKIRKQRDDILLLIAGPDNWGYRPKLVKTLREEGIFDKVVFTGMLDEGEKILALKHATIFALPSYSEGFSIAVLEAMACGLPVIITRQCNFPEVEKEQCGRVIDVDAGQLSRALLELLNNPELAAEMGMNGRRLVRKYYSLDTIADKLIETYEKALS